ncbi:MAG: hypothetical protein ABR583_12310 [Gaiellaceae bacterium]
MRARVVAFVLLAVVTAAVAGCAGADDDQAEANPAPRRAAACPAAWKPGWQRVAARVRAPVFCPSWMPNPLTGEIGGPWDNGVSIDRDRSYLVSFLYHEAGNDVHVNFRGYPGRTRVPRCEDVQTAGGKTLRRPVPCFADPQRPRRIGRFRVTLYTANRDVDQWHLLYAWRYRGSLYTLSAHVAPPYTLAQVRRNLARMLRSLTLVRPPT